MKKRGFYKGCKPWNKGKHITDLHKLHISQATRGRPKPWLCKPLSKEHIKNMSKALKGVPKSEQHKRNMSLGKLSYWKNKHLLMITQLKK
jgi:hypothetical protein